MFCVFAAFSLLVGFAGQGHLSFSYEYLKGAWRVFGVLVGHAKHRTSEVDEVVVSGEKRNVLRVRSSRGRDRTVLAMPDGSNVERLAEIARCYLA